MRLFYETELGKLYRGEALKILESLPDKSVDAVITDPPYSSGGFSRDDKNHIPSEKYQKDGTKRRYPDFSGDNRDQRSWIRWCSLWGGECVRLLKPGGYFLMFSDWRQLPAASDALQSAGVFWRGIIAWDKTAASRAPHKGYFRHQCEYILWGTKGACPVRQDAGPFPGCFTFPVLQPDKHHLTGKPSKLMRALVDCMPPGAAVLDPFAGSGTTAVACEKTGRRWLAVEREEEYCEIAARRLEAERRESVLERR